jgi:hypothetical protein
MRSDHLRRKTLSRHSISTLLALLIASSAAQAQPRAEPPDPTTFGARIEAGNIAQARAWLDAGLDPDYVGDRVGTGLMIAAWEGNLPLMQLFVARGANVNKLNARGESALMHAAWRGKLDAVKWLLARGAAVNSEPGRWSALHYAAFAGHADVVETLLAAGADINARSANGSSPLMMAVYEDHPELVRQLMQRGADASIKNDRGDGALEWAFKFGRLGIARMVAAPQEFAAAASRPKSYWSDPVRSRPAGAADDPLTRQIDDLVDMRDILASRGMTSAVSAVDRRIARLRFQRAVANMDVPSALLEITARRSAPADQKARLIVKP